ncbi:GSCOCG00000749001-RA-CDS [Cotesia congregata]|uniref:Uncharacterized protein n=1 Tax=Cotesia congregata TaxID=51543 RepID=A0A8J2MJE8_COTCN|nr:GSCOCG00000749001-RA-CDS [Cotesia congregata]CAG5095417.1 Protein of unknown function [Cotesia congregata]
MSNPTKMTSNVNFPGKSFTLVAVKPKGLSIRSRSELNIALPAKSSSAIKVDEAKKSTLTLFKDKVSKNVLQIQKQGLSPNSKSPHKEVSPVFKKPLPPKVNTHVYPPAEKLASSYGFKENFDRVLRRAEALDKEANELSAILKPANRIIKPFEDDLDREPLTIVIEKDYPRRSVVNEDLTCSDVEIPTLPDED